MRFGGADGGMALCAFSLVILSLMAGCLGGSGPVIDPVTLSNPPDALTENSTRFLRFSTWPSDAMAMEVRVDCDCHGEKVLLGWTFAVNWSGQESDVDSVEQTNVRDGVDVDLFGALVVRERMESSRSPVVARADILRSAIVGVGVSGTYAAMVGTGLTSNAEVSMPSGRGGDVFVSYEQEFPLWVEMDGAPLRLVFVATNGTGHRTLPEFDLHLEVPPTANVTVRSGSSRAFAYDEPLLEHSVGAAVDVNYPRRAHARAFGESSMEWNSKGQLLYAFTPWAGAEGVQDATYRIEAPDHSYRVRLNYTNGEGGYQCLDGCDGLGGTYALNAGLAPPGTTRFTVEGATCATDSGCFGIMVGVDLGRMSEPVPAST